MANQIINKALAHLGKLNLISCERVSTTVTTGATGNISLGVTNDGRTGCFGGHISGSNYYVRLWVAESGVWFATVINPNTGATINNTTVALRYWVLKFTSDTKMGGVKLIVVPLVLMWHRWLHEQSDYRQEPCMDWEQSFKRHERMGHHSFWHQISEIRQSSGADGRKRYSCYWWSNNLHIANWDMPIIKYATVYKSKQWKQSSKLDCNKWGVYSKQQYRGIYNRSRIWCLDSVAPERGCA